MSLLVLVLVLVLFSPSTALSAVTVTHLRGFNGALPFHLETRYVSVDEGRNVELFYYFMHSKRNPREDPLILWLTRGPSCSGFSTLAFEIGPLKFMTAKYNGSLPSLVYNRYSWTKIANIIFLDYPAGTGFSVSTNPKGSIIDDRTSSKQWFIEHQSFLSSDVYTAGDSYGGIEDGHQRQLNLKVVGNPITDDSFEITCWPPYAHGMGIISDELYESYATYLSYYWANNYYTRQALLIKKLQYLHVVINTTIANTYMKDVLSTVIISQQSNAERIPSIGIQRRQGLECNVCQDTSMDKISKPSHYG